MGKKYPDRGDYCRIEKVREAVPLYFFPFAVFARDFNEALRKILNLLHHPAYETDINYEGIVAMNTDKVYYTDGHEVVVTSSTLKVNNKEYRLPGITRHGLSTLKPQRAPGLLLFVIGMLVVVIGVYKLIPPGYISNVLILDRWVTVNDWAVVGGALIAAIGLLVAMLVKPKYAVHIATAEGEHDVVVSTHREYIRQIIEGLNKAFVARGSSAA